jgi:hypothetical protein
MKIYPKTNEPPETAGFTAEEIKKGHHWLYADVTCTVCGKLQSLAMAGGTPGKCIKCGGLTQ